MVRGGRQNYARKWFGLLPPGLIKAITDKGAKSADIHDSMAMERDAEKKAQKLLQLPVQ